VGSKPGASGFHLFSSFHHFTAESQRLPNKLKVTNCNTVHFNKLTHFEWLNMYIFVSSENVAIFLFLLKKTLFFKSNIFSAKCPIQSIQQFLREKLSFPFGCNQGCQMVYFRTKNPNLGKLWRALEWKMLVYFMPIWNILWPFGTPI
jgi:hypothetical protein